MKTYKIKRGCAFAWPRPLGLINVKRTDKVSLFLRLDEKSYISEEEYKYGKVGELKVDKDYSDAHKALGLTSVVPAPANNAYSILHAFQFQKDNGFGVMAYWNDADKSIPKSFPFKRMEFGDVSELEITNLSRKGFNWALKINNEVVDKGSHEWFISRWFPYVRVIGCSFGGANNAEGPLGDKAPKEIIFQADYKK